MVDDGVNIHPTIALVKTNLADNLQNFVDAGERKLGLWIAQNNFIKVDCSDQPKCFVNLNSPKDFDGV